MKSKINCALRPDAQGFDEVRIVTVPRYKESYLSGDEWRISATIELLRKGNVVASRGVRDIEIAAAFLPAFLHESIDNGHAYYAGDGVHCDQEGCSDLASIRYRKKADYCRDGHNSEPPILSYRHFCDRHKIRGNCGFDDADANYVQEPWK